MLECVVNVSEGRDASVLDALAGEVARDLLDVHTDPHHNRSVFTLVGTEAPRLLAASAVARLDLRAPFGYALGTGRIRPPSFSLPAGVTRAEGIAITLAFRRLRVDGGPLPARVRVGTPTLAPCQVLLPGERNATCAIATAGGR